MRNHRPDFAVLSGDDGLTLPVMALGGRGIISVISNLVPGKVKALEAAASRGDFDQAREIHYELLPIVRAAFIETNPIPIKAAMNYAGLPSGGCRLPLCDLSPENSERVKRVLEAYEVLV